MTDEQRPWQDYGEWEQLKTAVRGCDPLVQFDVQAFGAKLCARVWREAGMAHIPLQDDLYRANARADAAEAQRDRLASALRQLHDAVDDFNAGSDKDDDVRQHLCWLCGASTYGGDGVIHEPRCAVLDARAALADSGEA